VITQKKSNSSLNNLKMLKTLEMMHFQNSRDFRIQAQINSPKANIDFSKENKNWRPQLMLKIKRLIILFKSTTQNQSNSLVKSKASMKVKSKDLRKGFRMKRQDLRKRCNKLLRIMKISFKKCQIITKMLIMLLRMKRMLSKLTCRIY
jgi:hypothetical protein